MLYCADTMPHRTNATDRIHIFFTDIRAMGRCPCYKSTTCQACLDAGADRYMIKATLPKPPPTAPAEQLGPDGNPHYPLLSTTAPPLPYVRPADVMVPTALEAESAIKCNLSKMPVAPVCSCSAPVTLEKGVYHPPAIVKVGPSLYSSEPHSSALMVGMTPPHSGKR